jgi:hypothetical protein
VRIYLFGYAIDILRCDVEVPAEVEQLEEDKFILVD